MLMMIIYYKDDDTDNHDNGDNYNNNYKINGDYRYNDKKIYKIDNIVTCSNHNLIIIYCSNMTGRYYDD